MPDHIREGTEVANISGRFQQAGRRVVFITADGEHRLVALENLNLERIVKQIEKITDTVAWKVRGSLTEYQGQNYLLIHRAVIVGNPRRPASRR